MNRKGFELSVNFLVILILSLAILAGGIIFVKNIVSSTLDTKTELDAQTKAEINRMLTSGQRVGIPFNNIEIQAGKSAVLGVGILNVDVYENFRVLFVYSEGFAADGTAICQVNNSENCPDHTGDPKKTWAIMFTPDHTIRKNEQKSVSIYIKPPKGAPRGQYIFNVGVQYKDANSNYVKYTSTTSKVTIKVV